MNECVYERAQLRLRERARERASDCVRECVAATSCTRGGGRERERARATDRESVYKRAAPADHPECPACGKRAHMSVINIELLALS